MNLGRWQRTIVDLAGNVIPGAVITIRRESDQQLVTVYGDKAGEHPYTPTGQATADANGYAYFYVEPGLYRITSSNPAVDWRDVEIGSVEIAQEVDQSWRDFEAQAEYEHDNLRAMLMQSRYGDGPYPTIDWQFAGASRLDPRITFTRASADTVYDASGRLVTLGNDEPAFPFDPATGRALGFRVQAQATNLITNSQGVFQNNASTDVLLNQATGPDGELSLHFIRELAATAEHFAQDQLNVESGKYYVYSVYMKDGPNSNRNLNMRIAGATASAQAQFDPVSKQWTEVLSTDLIDYGHEELPNGIFRIWICFLPVASGNCIARAQLFSSAGNNYEGDGESGLYVNFRQIEKGTYPSSYIKTGASQATRAAEFAAVEGGALTDWLNPSEGTFVISLLPRALVDNEWLFSLDSPGQGQVFGIYMNKAGVLVARHNGGTAVTSATPGGTAQSDVPLKVALKYGAGKFNQVVGSFVSVPADINQAAMALCNKLLVGGTSSTSAAFQQCNCPLQSFTYYPHALSDAQLQALTS